MELVLDMRYVYKINVVGDLQLAQLFDGPSVDSQANISWITIKLNQRKIVHNTDLKMNGL